MKTVAQIIDEYNKRRANPQYELITVVGCAGDISYYSNVKNIERTQNDGNWLEFDSDSDCKEGIHHIQIFKGKITKYVYNTK